MSGRFHPRITFPLYDDHHKKVGRFELEPFFSTNGYGVMVKIIHIFKAGFGEDEYEYERVMDKRAIIREMLTENVLWEMFADFIEGLYHNKVNQDVAVPIAALLLKTHFSDIVNQYQLDLDEYITEIEFNKPAMGFDSHAKRDTNETGDQEHQESSVEKESDTGDQSPGNEPG